MSMSVKVYTVVGVYLCVDAHLSNQLNCHTELKLTASQIDYSQTNNLCNTKWVSINTHKKTYMPARLWIN